MFQTFQKYGIMDSYFFKVYTSFLSIYILLKLSQMWPVGALQTGPYVKGAYF